jgi:hypothetical protein
MGLCNIHEISFDFVDDLTDDPVVTITVTTPAGPLTLLAEPVMDGTTMVLNGLHVQDLTPNAVGPGKFDGDRTRGHGRNGLGWTPH